MTSLAERNGGRAGLAILVVVLLLGPGLRVNEAWQGRSPVFDAAAYAKIAANLDEGSGFTLGSGATQPASNYSPGMPLFAAGVYKLTGGVHERLARVVLALIGTFSVLFTYLIGRRLSGPVAGLIGAAALPLHPAFLEYQGMLMGEPLAATLLSGAVLATFWAAGPTDSARGSCRGGPPPHAQTPDGVFRCGGPPPPRHPRVRWVLTGALLGALTLVRPEYLAVALLVSLVVLVRDGRRDWSQTRVQALLVLGGVAIIVAPWTVRNAIALDRFAPVATGGGQGLFAGTYLPSDGDPEKGGAEGVERHPELFGPHAVERLRLEQVLGRLAEERYPGAETD